MIFRFRQLSQWIWSIGIVSMFTLVLLLQQQPQTDDDDVTNLQHAPRDQRAASIQTINNARRAQNAQKPHPNINVDQIIPVRKANTISNHSINVDRVVEVEDSPVQRIVGDSVISLTQDERALLNKTQDPDVAAAIRLFYHYKQENDRMIAMIPEDQRVLPTGCPPKLTEISSKNTLPRTGLLSFPGSGNTWVRHLIQLATGKMTGSNYNDASLKRTGFPGEGRQNGHMIVNKNHETGVVEMPKYDRAVVISRNPYDSVVSEFNRRRSGHLGRAKEATFKSPKSLKEIAVMADWWEVFHVRWLKLFPHPVHVVRYEDLKRDLRTEMRKMLTFLGWPSSEAQLDCVASMAEGKNHRKGSTSFDPFTPTQQELMKGSAKRVDLLIANRTLPVIT